ncbi:MAG TPA: HAD family phosphatase [Patescibacteria group bacterium]|nr:HAD family phosphatase [Patescibacteria group bacterium]
MIKAVLFDMDGLFVDSETLAMEVVLKVCEQLQIPLLPGKEKDMVGVTAKKFFTELLEDQSTDTTPELALNKFTEIYEEQIRTNLVIFDGAKSLPLELKSKGLRLALISGSTRDQIEIILTQIGTKELFEEIVSAEDITHSKPSPEGYLLGANKLGLSPNECIVVEDAEAGVAAAKAAGMKVIGVHNTGEQNLSEADKVVGTLAELTPEMIMSIIVTD